MFKGFAYTFCAILFCALLGITIDNISFDGANTANAAGPIRNMIANARQRQRCGERAPVANACQATRNVAVGAVQRILPPYGNNAERIGVAYPIVERKVERSVCLSGCNVPTTATPKAESKNSSDAPTLDVGTQTKKALKLSVAANGEINVLVCNGATCQTIPVTLEETDNGNFLLRKK